MVIFPWKVVAAWDAILPVQNIRKDIAGVSICIGDIVNVACLMGKIETDEGDRVKSSSSAKLRNHLRINCQK